MALASSCSRIVSLILPISSGAPSHKLARPIHVHLLDSVEPGAVIEGASLSLAPYNLKIAWRTLLADKYAIVFAPSPHRIPELVMIEPTHRVPLGVPIGRIAIDQHILGI